MPSLKELKNRIGSVKNTRKITSAMKMVAASKLRRAQEKAEAARPYAQRLGNILKSLSTNLVPDASTPKLIAGTGQDKTVLLLVLSSDRGLCGGFNGNIVKEARKQIRQLQGEGKTVKVICVGRKARDLLRRDHAVLIVQSFEDVGRKGLTFSETQKISDAVAQRFDAGEFDVARLLYTRFKSVISQIVTVQQIVPVQMDAANQNAPAQAGVSALYEFEPDEGEILTQLLPKNLAMQVYTALLESAASEQGARMTAMDNATRNAGEMINKLTLTYNRNRQAYITKEMIEIVSGAEAV